MRKIFSQQVTIWKIKIQCHKCPAFTEFILRNGRAREIANSEEAEEAVPSEGFNGWYLGKHGKEMCPSCYYRSPEFRQFTFHVLGYSKKSNAHKTVVV